MINAEEIRCQRKIAEVIKFGRCTNEDIRANLQQEPMLGKLRMKSYHEDIMSLDQERMLNKMNKADMGRNKRTKYGQSR